MQESIFYVFFRVFFENIEASTKSMGGIEILFRDKSYGWRNFSMSYSGKVNGKEKFLSCSY